MGASLDDLYFNLSHHFDTLDFASRGVLRISTAFLFSLNNYLDLQDGSKDKVRRCALILIRDFGAI